MHEMGVGLPAMPIKHMTTAKLTTAIVKLTSDKELQARASTFGEHIRSQDGVARAVEVFHNIVRKYPKRGKFLIEFAYKLSFIERNTGLSTVD